MKIKSKKKIIKYKNFFLNKTNSKFTASLSLYDDFLSNCGHDRIQKIISKYELFKLTLNTPGDIVECGVHKGSGIYLFSKLVKIFKPHTSTKILGFDFFESSRKTKNKFKKDSICIREHAGRGSSRKKILNNLKKNGIKNVSLITGDVVKSTKNYVKKKLGFRISLLVLDVDNYEATLACLKNLYPFVTKGGVIVFDEYALKQYGESDAVDEYFKNHKIKIRSLPLAPD